MIDKEKILAAWGNSGIEEKGQPVTMEKGSILKAMDEYAKEVALDFLKFGLKGYIHGDMDGNPHITNFTTDSPETPEELFTLYIDNQTKTT